jgi:glycosyltransferase domain-containing protein
MATAATLNFTVIVADNSTTYNKLPETWDIPGNVRFLHFTDCTFTEKVNLALELVTTPYVALWADDDFYLPSGIEKMLLFLQNNQEYTAVHGYTLSFFQSNKQVGYEKMYAQEKSIAVNQDQALTRVQTVFSPYLPLFYSIHRTNSFQSIFQSTVMPENLSFVEFQIAYLAVVQGKFACLPVLFHIREQALFSAGFVSKSLVEMKVDPKETFAFRAFMEFLGQRTSDLIGVSRTTGLEMAEKSFESYFQWVNSTQLMHQKWSYAWWKRNYIKPLLPTLFTLLVKYKKQKTIASHLKEQLSLMEYLNQQQILSELAIIEELIIKYPLN